jgi:FkbM family methyltransferase
VDGVGGAERVTAGELTDYYSARMVVGPLRRAARRLVPGRLIADGVWLHQRRQEPLDVLPFGPSELTSFLLRDSKAVAKDVRHYQNALSIHLRDQLLAHVLKRQNVNVVLDVGAHRGGFAKSLRELGYVGRIVSYEPVSTNLELLRSAAADDPHWLVEGFALGDAETRADINVSAGRGKLSSLLPGSEYGRERFPKMRDEDMRTESIRIRRLDTVYERAIAGVEQPRVFIKMDTQGYDLRAWSGCGSLVDDFVGLQSEVSCIPIYEGMPHLTEQIETYERSGLAIAGLAPVMRDHKSLAVIEFDLLMIRR